MGAGNGASDLFLAMHVAPPGVYLKEVQLPFQGQSGQKTMICQQGAYSLDIFPSSLLAHPATSSEAAAKDRSGLGTFQRLHPVSASSISAT